MGFEGSPILMHLTRKLTQGLAVATAAAGVTLIPAAAHAAPYYCSDPDRIGNYCAKVTGIDPGSYLALHKGPNYRGGAWPGIRLHNGETVHLVCWTTGSGDIDGHRDYYWFQVDFSDAAPVGYVNDWYLTTGSYSQWHRYVRQHS
jgi:hypothetical protein